MTDKEYFALDAISASLLKRVYRKEYFEVANNISLKASDAMRFGTYLHCLVLEPEEAKKRFVIMPELNLRTKEGKEIKAKIESENTDKEIITLDEQNRALNALESLRNTNILNLFKSGLKEFVIRFEIDGKACKSKIDFYNENSELLIDFKTTSKSGNDFLKDCKNLHYNLQLAFYRDALLSQDKKVKKAFIIGVQSKYPYKITIVELDENELNLGREKYKIAMKMLEKIKNEKAYSLPLECDILGNNIFQLVSDPWHISEIENFKELLGVNHE